jgi:hypothetical protein
MLGEVALALLSLIAGWTCWEMMLPRSLPVWALIWLLTAYRFGQDLSSG